MLDADDFQRFDQIEEADGPDAAQAGLADPVVVDVDVEQPTCRDDSSAALAAAGRASWNGERDLRVAGPRHLDCDAHDRAGRTSVLAGDRQAAQRDAVA